MRYHNDFDQIWGFGRAPKFPTPVNLDFLLRYFRRTGDTFALSMVEINAEKNGAGWSTTMLPAAFTVIQPDRRWLVPHFEKMLYDNAQLVPVYLDMFTYSRTLLPTYCGRNTRL